MGNIRPERSTALVARELHRYNIDVAALSETRLHDSGSLTGAAGGYTFYWKGKHSSEKHESGVGFAIKSSIRLSELPVGHSDRIMSLRLLLNKQRSLHLISVYAPTMQHSDIMKDAFYEDLSAIIRTIPAHDKCIVLGDFNARVGNDFPTWPSVLGHHRIGNVNSNGNLLLTMCAENNLTITNSYFQLPNKLKTTWKHARSGHWHLIDYIITKSKDISDFHVTRVMRGADCWTDHRLLISKVCLKISKPAPRKAQKIAKKFCVSKLKSEEVATSLRTCIDEQLQNIAAPEWDSLKTVLLNSAETVLGYQKHSHKDWFDENDVEIAELMKARMNEIGDRLKEIKRTIANRLRVMKDKWWQERAEETHRYADTGNAKELFRSLNVIYGPKKSSVVPLLNSDGTKLLTTSDDIRERWTEHFTQLLSETSIYDEDVINNLPQ
ncbi:craniofacial development protein 2-like [Xenia sp. Carnegie-2017]|uniref:craniofacial development protein 2-like n=1 Tax=Xenia sp. Carnegie-2017 TaxID=2897299 RepID=UPI001F0383F2|nr:craniofacial development protein 2-like [Xenia sp. Carnegie-2017]